MKSTFSVRLRMQNNSVPDYFVENEFMYEMHFLKLIPE